MFMAATPDELSVIYCRTALELALNLDGIENQDTIMNKTLLVIVALLFASAALGYWLLVADHEGDENDPIDLHAYLAETDEMVERGDYSAALERYIWFHEHALEHDPHFSGVRLSFALCGWWRLAELYPPAMEALVETRDRAVARVRAGAGDWDVFSDVESLNKTLDEDALTIELFEELHERQPALAEQVWGLARSEVVAAGRYELAREYFGNPMDELAAIRRSYERGRGMFEDDEESAEFYREFRENRFVERTLELVQVFGGLGRDDLVEQIGAEALETLREPRIEYAMKQGLSEAKVDN